MWRIMLSFALFVACCAPISVLATDNANTTAVSVSSIANPTRFFGQTPAQIFKQFGVPARASATNCCTFYDHHPDLLFHSYNVSDGGRIAFLFVQPWHVIAVVFDNQDSSHYYKLADFFPAGIPRLSRIAACTENDFYHATEGDMNPDGQRVVSIYSVLAKWVAPWGGQFVAEYRIGVKPATTYDPVLGKQAITLPSNFVDRPMVEWGVLGRGLDQIGDLNIANNTDFSTLLNCEQ